MRKNFIESTRIVKESIRESYKGTDGTERNGGQ